MALTLKQITDALLISRPRVEKWISLGYFRTPDKPMLGMARDWDVTDAVRLRIMVDLVEAGLPAPQAGAMVIVSPAVMSDFGLVPFVKPYDLRNDHGFFVAWQGFAETLIYPNGRENEPLRSYDPGSWLDEKVWASNLATFLSSPNVLRATVVDINNTIDRVNAALGTDQV